MANSGSLLPFRLGANAMAICRTDMLVMNGGGD